MLSIIYKCFFKLLATRLSPHKQIVINTWQTGFIPNKFILKNILLAWLTYDWLVQHGTAALFLKLDFEKAFDKVKHAYIWAVLQKIGLGGTFLMLVQGLLTGATTKVHINDRFMEEISVTQGVRQGCLLSPLLSALTMQPLTEYLEHKLSTRELEWIKISETLTICHHLFAKDVGIFIPTSKESFKMQCMFKNLHQEPSWIW